GGAEKKLALIVPQPGLDDCLRLRSERDLANGARVLGLVPLGLENPDLTGSIDVGAAKLDDFARSHAGALLQFDHGANLRAEERERRSHNVVGDRARAFEIRRLARFE